MSGGGEGGKMIGGGILGCLVLEEFTFNQGGSEGGVGLEEFASGDAGSFGIGKGTRCGMVTVRPPTRFNIGRGYRDGILGLRMPSLKLNRLISFPSKL